MVEGLFRDRAILTIDGRQRLLKAGETSPEGVTLVSANAREAVLEIDGERRSYGLGGHISSSYAGPPPGVVVQLWPDRQGMYLASGAINGFPTRFLVDTGATVVAMNRNDAKRFGVDFRLDGKEGRTHTASGTAKAWYVTLARVRVGDIELRDVEAAVLDGDHPVDVLLGNSFLGRLDLSREGQILELRKD